MGVAYHTFVSPDGAGLNLFGHAVLGTVTAVYGAGVSTGAAVTVAMTWGEPVVTSYTLLMSPIEDCTHFFTSKTTTGAVLNVNSRLATGTLTGGSVEVLILS